MPRGYKTDAALEARKTQAAMRQGAKNAKKQKQEHEHEWKAWSGEVGGRTCSYCQMNQVLKPDGEYI